MIDLLMGFSINGIDATVDTVKTGEVNINYSHKIINVSEIKPEDFKFEGTVANVDFEFKIMYSQKGEESAHIVLKGNCMWKDGKKFVDGWKKKEGIPKDLLEPFINILYRRCLILCVNLASHLNLPSPVPLPRISLEKK